MIQIKETICKKQRICRGINDDICKDQNCHVIQIIELIKDSTNTDINKFYKWLEDAAKTKPI